MIISLRLAQPRHHLPMVGVGAGHGRKCSLGVDDVIVADLFLVDFNLNL